PKFNFTTLTGFPLGTYGAQAYAFNDVGQIVGSYVDSGGVQHGFLNNGGAFITLDAPGAVSQGTQAFGINNAGQIVGEDYDSGGVHGYSYSSATYGTINAPSAGGTYASSINALGQIVGIYFPGPQGFLDAGGVFTTLPTYLGGYFQVTGINNAGQ